MSKMRDAILNAVILIAMDDDQSLHELIQYMVTDLLSDNFMIDFSNDAETSEEYLNNWYGTLKGTYIFKGRLLTWSIISPISLTSMCKQKPV